jgi:AraC family transcriptional regulator of adaptative response/methylated-DNA-[protein]-cysteine methyltransferase
VVTYGLIAHAIGAPKAARAIGGACAANPIALMIPCHRVLRDSGALGGYAFGLDRKRALLAWEAASPGTGRIPRDPVTGAIASAEGPLSR